MSFWAWFFGKERGVPFPDIKVGCWIISNGKYPNIDKYFKDGPLQVVRKAPLPDYAGGFAVYCMLDGNEVGFYINGVKRVL